MHVQRNIEARSRYHCWYGKAINVEFYACVFVLSNLWAVLCRHLCVSTLSHNLHDFRRKSYGKQNVFEFLFLEQFSFEEEFSEIGYHKCTHSVVQFSLFGGYRMSEGKLRRNHRGGHCTVSAVCSNEGTLWGEWEEPTCYSLGNQMQS